MLEEAKELGNNFLYVVGYAEELNCYILDVEENDVASGNFYNEDDLVEYIEHTQQEIKFDELHRKQVVLSNGIIAQVNQIDERYFLENCEKENGNPVWFDGLENCKEETFNYEDVQKLYKLFGEIIQFIEQNKPPTKEMTLEQIEKELGYKIKLV